ncbi:tripartite motif-containing protein 71 [Mytilus galloprovincialis]|uniref:Tripartite motif-containing protein 71 n=1 Tax=Mytilus galloprovincialis TaxID=29158 RepID=A0A8B6ED48_MYTGA|nr:tripartite motif-containing protein 71 [Mytilus galloprovincialis]
MAFSKSVIRSQIPINCNLCETEKNIKWKCLTCGVLMCSTCKDKIHLRIAKDHKVVDIKNVGLPVQELDFTNIKCQDHSEQSSCLFCTKCDKLVCPTCVSKIHKKHDLTEISDAYNLKIDKLKKKQSKLQKEKYEIITTKDQLNQFQNADNSNYTKVSTDILNHEKVLKQAVEKHIAKLRNELEQNHKASSKVNEECIKVISKSERQIDEKYSDVQDFIHTTDISKFFQNVNRIEKSTEVSVTKPEISRRTKLQFIPGEITQSNIGVLQSVDIPSAEVKVSLSVVNQYQTNLSLVADLSPCHDDSLWIACDPDVVLQKVKPEETNLKTISNFNIKVFGMTITPSDDLLIIGKSRLQMMSSTTDKVKDSVYDINPFLAIAVHITSGGQIIVGGGTNEGRRAVFVLNKDGDHEAVYEHNKHNQPIFSYPRRITTTSNGNIHVVDYYKDGDSGKVVVLGKADDVINIYKGDTEINKKVPFIPEGIVTTPRDNVIVVDLATNTLHILNNSGHLITYIKTTDIGIEDAYSLAFSQTGQLYIGCNEANDSTAKEAKLYKVNISGC